MSAAMRVRRRASSGLERGVSRSACSARSAAAAGAPREVRRSGGLLEDVCDVAVGRARGEREMARSFLGGRHDVGEPCVKGSAAGGSLACRDSGAQQRMGESHVLAVELENPRVERLGKRTGRSGRRAPPPEP